MYRPARSRSACLDFPASGSNRVPRAANSCSSAGSGMRDRDGHRRPGGQGFRCVGADGLAVALQDEVCVRARPSEPAHACPRRTTGNDRPLGRLRRHPHREPLPVDLRVRRVEVQVLRDDPVLHRQHHLDEAGGACRRFQVPDVRLHRPDEQRTVGVASPAVHRSRGLHLDRVAHRRSRPVRLHVVHFPRFESRLEQRRLDHLLLGGLARHRQSRTRPVLVQRRCPDDAPYPVAVRLRLAQPLQHQDAAAFAPDVAVRRGIERLALPVGGQHPPRSRAAPAACRTGSRVPLPPAPGPPRRAADRRPPGGRPRATMSRRCPPPSPAPAARARTPPVRSPC